MDSEHEQQPGDMIHIPLDGTFGAGPDAELTIVTKGEDGENVERVYIAPYFALNLPRVQAMCDVNLILGYKIVKGEAKLPALKELGL